jgi:hypothetical protein
MKFEKHVSEERGNMDLDLSDELPPATRSKKMSESCQEHETIMLMVKLLLSMHDVHKPQIVVFMSLPSQQAKGE